MNFDEERTKLRNLNLGSPQRSALADHGLGQIREGLETLARLGYVYNVVDETPQVVEVAEGNFLAQNTGETPPGETEK